MVDVNAGTNNVAPIMGHPLIPIAICVGIHAAHLVYFWWRKTSISAYIEAREIGPLLKKKIGEFYAMASRIGYIKKNTFSSQKSAQDFVNRMFSIEKALKASETEDG